MDLPIRPLSYQEIIATHDLYKTRDRDAPDQIRDRNGEVVLACCRKCGLAEVELTHVCEKRH